MADENRSSASGFEITLGGTTLKPSGEEGGVQLITIEDHVDMVNMMTVRMGGTEGQPEWSWKVGDDVSAKVGQGTSELFKGQIVSMEPSYQVEGIGSINIRCMDKTHILGRGRKTKAWEDMKDSDVVSEVASECGLSVDAQDTGTVHPYILRRNESAIAFCKRLAARNNYLLMVEDGSLLFKPAEFGGSVFTVKMGDNLRSMRMSFNSNDQVQEAVVRGWDIMKKEAIVGKATTGDFKKIGGGELGADKSSQFGSATAYITDVPVSSQEQADAIAKHELNRISRSYCRGSAGVQGDDKIRAGKMITIEGLQEGNNGDFFVVSSRHIISNRTGYTTEFSFCSNCAGT